MPHNDDKDDVAAADAAAEAATDAELKWRLEAGIDDTGFMDGADKALTGAQYDTDAGCC